MDLQPKEYKCIPRNYKAIAALVVLLLVIPGMWFGLKYFYQKQIQNMEQVSEDEINSVNENISRLKSEIANLEDQLKKAIISPDKIFEINKKVDFFNRIYQKSFSWFDFFDKIEKLTPQDVWVKKINIKGDDLENQEFEIICEAKEQYHAPEFLKNLMKYKEFVPLKDQNSIAISQVAITQTFGYEFALKFRFYPFKRITVDPEFLKFKVNESKEIKVYILNIIEQKKQLDNDDYIYEMVNPDGAVLFEDKIGVLKGVKPGKGFLKISTPDKKYSSILNFEVTN